MALFNKKEFAEKCGMTTRELAVYIKRDKVDINSDGQIDDTTIRNIDFISRHSEKKLGQQPPRKSPSKKSVVKNNTAKAEHVGSNLLYDLDKQKKMLEIQSTQHRNELLTIELAKKNGKLIPTDEVKSLFAQHSKSIIMSFKQFIEGFLAEIAQKSKLNANQVAELRGRMIVMLNQSVDDAVDTTRQNLQNILSDMANAKEKA